MGDMWESVVNEAEAALLGTVVFYFWGLFSELDSLISDESREDSFPTWCEWEFHGIKMVSVDGSPSLALETTDGAYVRVEADFRPWAKESDWDVCVEAVKGDEILFHRHYMDAFWRAHQ